MSIQVVGINLCSVTCHFTTLQYKLYVRLRNYGVQKKEIENKGLNFAFIMPSL